MFRSQSSAHRGPWRTVHRPPEVLGALLAAAMFCAATVTETQVQSVRAHSPWQDDPYDVAISLAQVTVPVLAVLLVLRMASPRRPGPDARLQLRRAAAAMVLVIDLVACSEWAALAVGAHRPAWDGHTGGLVAGLAVISAAALASSVTLARAGALRRRRRPWSDDWLADLTAVIGRLPGLRWVASDAFVGWARRHAVALFVASSAIGAGVVIGAMAYGERWTDPALIAWALCVETAANFCVCMIANTVAGVVARSAPKHPRWEMAATGACAAVQVAVAFRVPIWRAVAGHPPQAMPPVAVLSTGAFIAGGAITALAVTATRRRATGPAAAP